MELDPEEYKGGIPSYETLSALSDREIIERYDALRGRGSDVARFWLDERSRREAARQTRAIVRLTWLILVLTLANAGFIAYQVFCQQG